MGVRSLSGLNASVFPVVFQCDMTCCELDGMLLSVKARFDLYSAPIVAHRSNINVLRLSRWREYLCFIYF